MKRLCLAICLLSSATLLHAQSAPALGSAQSFAVLGATTVTSAGSTVITGNIGVSPGTSITGFPPAVIYAGALDAGGPAATAAQADAVTAYNTLFAETCGTILSGEVLGTSPGATTLAPGVYCFDSSAQLTGTLTLSGNGVYIFQIGSTLTTASNSAVVLTNGATAGNVFWQVGSSATLGTNTILMGSVFAFVSDTVSGGSSVLGRIFALSGAVTLDTNTMTSPQNQQFAIVSDTTEPSAGFATSSDPNATIQCTLESPCPQKLTLFFNTINELPASLGSPNVLWATNSIDDPDQPVSVTATDLCGSNSSIQLANEDGSSYTLSGTIGTGNSDPCLSSPGAPTTGSYSLSTGEVGTYTIEAFPDPSGTYTGTFNDTGSSGENHGIFGDGSDTLSVNVNPDFSVISTLVVAPGELCPAQTTTLTLSSSDSQAIADGVDPIDGISSISLGDSVLLSLADESGNVAWLVMTGDDANANQLSVGSLYVTGFSPAGVCSGTFFYDQPFARKGIRARVGRRVRPPRHRVTNWERRILERARERREPIFSPRLNGPRSWSSEF